jgi:hypothetical protein
MRDTEPLELEAARSQLVETAMSELFLRFPPLAGYSETQLARTREDLGYILQFLEAALRPTTRGSSWTSSCPDHLRRRRQIAIEALAV